MSCSSRPCRRCAPRGRRTALNDQRVHKSVSGACGLTGFAVAIIAGLAADNPSSVILTRALTAMAVCYVIGMILGYIASRAVADATAMHTLQNPAPDIDEVRKSAQLAYESGLEPQQAPARAEAA